MKNRIFIILTTLSLLITFMMGQISCSNTQKTTYTMKNFEPGADYASNWKQVEEMESNGRTQDAKKAVEQILAKAEKDNNMQQIVKALLHQYKYSTFVEEGSDSLIVIDLKQQIESAEQPLKSVLQSILADVYWQYFQNNKYKILNRTNVAKELDDFQTWDTKRLTKEVKDLHLAAIADKELLRQAPLKMFDVVINQQKNARQFRPSLYDFLAHRALDYFTNDQANITTAADQFSLDNPAIFASSTGFAATTFSNTDELSTKYYALTILQDLVRLHIGDKTPEALIDVELKRLNFARKNAALPLKDQLYFQALRSLEEKHQNNAASGKISYEVARFLFDQSTSSGDDAEKTNIFSEMPKKDALDICNQVIEKFPNSQGANNCNALKEQIYHKSLSFQVEQANQPNAPFRTLVNYKNINKAYGRVVLITPEIENKASNFNRDDKRWNYYLSLPIVEDWTIELPQVGDFESHAVEMKVPALDVGKYMVMLATDGQFTFKKEGIAYQFTTITDLSIVARFDYAKNGQGYYVLNRQTGQPIQGVSYEAFLRRYENRKSGYVNDLIASGKSDKDGYFVVTKKNNKYNYGNLIIKLKNDKDSFTHNDYLRSSRSNKKVAKDKTFFFTDRAIYRPGQVIYFKGLMLKTDGKTSDLLTSKSSKVELYDVNYQKVSDLQLRTNEFGSFNGQFTLPTGLLNGQMTLRNESGSASIRVEEYKRPKFEVTFEPVKGSYRLNETVKVTGLAKAYAGVNLDGAMVKYRVVRKARFPYWGWWWRPAPSSAEREITNGTATTNADGTFDISFTAIPDATLNPDDKPQFSYTVYADVTDINGETQSKSTTVQVGYVSLLANIKMDKDLERNGDNNFAVSTTNLGGEFEAADVSITIHQLIAPERIYRTRLWSKADQFVMDEAAYHNDFPHDIYKDENELQNWERGKKVFDRSFTTTKSATIDLKDLASWDLGKYVVELKSKDKYGEAVELTNYVTVYDIDEKEIGTNDMGSFKLSQTTAEPGDVVTLAYGTATENSKVLVEVIKDNRIIRKDWFDISEGQRITNIKITEMHRGNLDIVVSMVKFNRLLSERMTINVPWSNKELNVEVQTFRNKLYPGAEEEWQLKISGSKGEKVAAEMLASMYDASLDAFASHNWYFDIYPRNATSSTLDPDSGFNGASSNFKSENWNPRDYSKRTQTYDALNWFGFYMGRNYYGGGAYAVKSASPKKMRRSNKTALYAPRFGGEADRAAPAAIQEESVTLDAEYHGLVSNEVEKKEASVAKPKADGSNDDNAGVQIRKNLQETAFFYPDLRTNANGEIIISFTAPEALTRWKLMTFSHTRDLKFQQLAQETITQKDLMVLPNIPRFFRENDEIILSSKVSNLTEKMLNGTASLQLFDALTMEPIDKDMANLTAKTNFTCQPNQSDVVSWSLKVPETVQAVTYRIIAKSGKFSDGEESSLPVLSNRMLVTESLPLPVRGNETKQFRFNKLASSDASPTLKHQRYTLEFTSQPAWYAIQALPYLMEYPHDCTEQIFSRYYANSIAAHVANSNPKIAAVFDSWKNEAVTASDRDNPAESGALLSNLQKNQELKAVMLEETPWVLAAKNESERKHRLGVLFDIERMSRELGVAEKELAQRQSGNGGWAWFPGMRESRYITQHLVSGMGHLDKMNIQSYSDYRSSMAEKALPFLDAKLHKDYQDLKRYSRNLKDDHLTYIQVHYLYTRSFYDYIPVQSQYQEAFDYYKGQAEKYWLSRSKYMQGMIALALDRFDKKDSKVAGEIMESLRQNAVRNDEMGMYYKSNTGGWYWYQAPIETQALLIEAFSEVANDEESVEDLKVWLLKQKQTQDWKTTKATTEACYALLMEGTDWLAQDALVDITIGDQKIDPRQMPEVKVEAGTGYFKKHWKGKEVTADMANITVSKKDKGVSWGAVYWQYFEQLDKITPAKTPLALKKELFLEKITTSGKELVPLTEGAKINVGDKVVVRVELRSDRDMEYIHLKDMRASGFEPVNVLSQYKYQDGLGYYESTKDASTNFFIGYLRKGTYVFEYPLRASHKGTFSNGITSVQCMYAPEFTSHSEGIRVEID